MKRYWLLAAFAALSALSLIAFNGCGKKAADEDDTEIVGSTS